MKRRDFLRGMASAAVMNAVLHPGCRRNDSTAPNKSLQDGLTGRRFLTFNSVIRVNQIEVTRTQNEGFDEYDRHTPENVLALRLALAEAMRCCCCG